MEIIADLHTHTMVSNHAFNTITEMARRAHDLGHFALAITDHGPLMPDSAHPWYFHNLTTLPHRMEDIWVLKGMEANVCNVDGTLDFDCDTLKKLNLDWLIVSIHSDTFPGPVKEDTVTQLWINVAENPLVDMIGHSESRFYPYDYDAVTQVFSSKKKVVELNANSCVVRPGNEQNLRNLALACKKNQTMVAVNSDAHSIYHLGRVNNILELLKDIDFPPELIVNASKENFIRLLRERQKTILKFMEETE
ncbi:phosphatase [uncultured Ruthenibacterium sp.]|uniref:phosphatase n=1 Tax=uncultured Ruthenibacterium sp. TaxID=1905347 RepID=UPI00349EA1DE